MIHPPLVPYVTVGDRRTWCPECFLPNGKHDSLCSHTEVKAS